MIEQEVVILNPRGLHARAAARFVQVASGFRSRVRIIRDGQTADGKSILGLLALLARPGMRLLIRVDGVDEGAAIAVLAALVAGRFEEGT